MKLLKNQKVIFGLLAISLLSGWFYWFQYRPSQIKAECMNKTKQKVLDDVLNSYESMDKSYTYCLHLNGL